MSTGFTPLIFKKPTLVSFGKGGKGDLKSYHK